MDECDCGMITNWFDLHTSPLKLLSQTSVLDIVALSFVEHTHYKNCSLELLMCERMRTFVAAPARRRWWRIRAWLVHWRAMRKWQHQPTPTTTMQSVVHIANLSLSLSLPLFILYFSLYLSPFSRRLLLWLFTPSMSKAGNDRHASVDIAFLSLSLSLSLPWRCSSTLITHLPQNVEQKPLSLSLTLSLSSTYFSLSFSSPIARSCRWRRRRKVCFRLAGHSNWPRRFSACMFERTLSRGGRL